MIKQLTGGDPMNTRGNFDKGQTTIIPMMHIFILCNIINEMSQDDDGSRRRIVNQPFVSKFVTAEDKKKAMYKGVKNIFVRDPSVETAIESGAWKLPFMWILLDHWKEYQKIRASNGGKGLLSIPSRIREHTENYFKEQSVVKDWLDGIIEYDPEHWVTDPSKSSWILSEDDLRPLRSPDVIRQCKTIPILRGLLETQMYLGKQTLQQKIKGTVYKRFWKGARLIAFGNSDGSGGLEIDDEDF